VRAAVVANAVPMLKEIADIRLAGERGAGVAELVEMVCRDDSRIIPPERHGLSVGMLHGREAFLEPHRGSVLIAGQSGIGKSTLAIALTERMVEKGFEFCIFDPEGDYDGLENAITIGDGDAAENRRGTAVAAQGGRQRCHQHTGLGCGRAPATLCASIAAGCAERHIRTRSPR
jgi:hypothetical protein